MTGVHRRYLIIGNQKSNFAGLSYPSYQPLPTSPLIIQARTRFDALESDGQMVRPPYL